MYIVFEIIVSEAEMLDEVCTSVQKEPMIQQLTGETVSGNLADGARLDVPAVGCLLTLGFFDPNTTYKNTTPVKVYEQHEREKNEYFAAEGSWPSG